MNKPFIIEGKLKVDDRGVVSFINDFKFDTVKRRYLVKNHGIGFIRAWHGHMKEGKFVTVINGTALIGTVSLTTDEISKYVLCDCDPKVLYIPPGYANGFKTLLNNTIIEFFSTSTLEESLGDDIRYPWDKWNIWKEDYR